jgi:hypothetical protein
MTLGKVHYNSTAGAEVVAHSRVAITCGAITTHAIPQIFVRETAVPELVTCKPCQKQVLQP